MNPDTKGTPIQIEKGYLKLLLIIVLSILFQQLRAQKPTANIKKPIIHKKAIKHQRLKIGSLNHHPSDDDCVFTSRYCIDQWLKLYPYCRAKKIIAVSFPGIQPNGNVLINDTLNVPDTIFKNELHIKNGKLNYSSIIEIKELNSEQIAKLTNIIYNTRVRKPSNYADPGYKCYNPRNALIFYDRDGKIFDYLEVCFECLQEESQSHKITIGTYCNQKYDLLKSIFIDVGIKYGTSQQ